MTFEKSAGFGRARARGDVQAFLDQRDELLLAHPLAPARQRRTVEHQRVPKELLAAEQLIIGVLDPALAQNLVGKVVHVLEDRKARHQTRRQGRMPRFVRVGRPEPLFQKAPVDRPRQLRQRMAHVDDLIQSGPEKVLLSAVPSLFRPHRESPDRASCRQRITIHEPFQFAR